MIVVTLAIVAAGGATAVFFVADAQHDRDRADITAWLGSRFPVAQDALKVVGAQELLLAHPLVEVRTTVSIALVDLLKDQTALLRRPIPEILEPVTARYGSAIVSAIAALDAANAVIDDGILGSGERERYAKLWRKAMSDFGAADAARRDLLCRARMPQCAA